MIECGELRCETGEVWIRGSKWHGVAEVDHGDGQERQDILLF